MNALVYPIFKIKGQESLFEGHNYFLEKNITRSSSLVDDCDIIKLEGEVNSWAEMINSSLLQISDLCKKGVNVLFSETDTVFLENFEEVFELDKLSLFALCNGGSKNNVFPSGQFFNAGVVYYPKSSFTLLNSASSLASSSRNLDSCESYETLINSLFYSQFSSREDSLSYAHNIGLSRYNWRPLLEAASHYPLPDVEDIKHIHFLNESEFTWENFWYRHLFDFAFNTNSKQDIISTCIKDYINTHPVHKSKLVNYLNRIQ